MKKMNVVFLIFLWLTLPIIISGCATAYKSDGLMGGYSSVKLDENVFQVAFRGNGYTSRERTSDFALLRCADIAIENGYKYFVIVDEQQYARTSFVTTPTTATTTYSGNTQGSVTSFGNSANFNANTYGTARTVVYGGDTFVIVKPSTRNTIVCFKDKPEGFAYNAETISVSIREKYGVQSK